MNIHTPSSVILGQASFCGTATANGSSFDTLGFRRCFAVFCATTAAASTSACKLQEASDNSTFTDVTGGGFATVAASNTAFIQWMDINLANRKRYLRLVHTVTGTVQATGEIFLLSAFDNVLVAQPNTVTTVS